MSNYVDGSDHIWLSHKGSTDLGRALDVGYVRDIDHPTYGKFHSFLAVMLWFQHNQNDAFRHVTGLNRDLFSINLGFNTSTPGAMKKASQVIEDHIRQDTALLQSMKSNDLPFHVYTLVPINGKEMPIYTSQLEWYVNLLTRIQNEA